MRDAVTTLCCIAGGMPVFEEIGMPDPPGMVVNAIEVIACVHAIRVVREIDAAARP